MKYVYAILTVVQDNPIMQTCISDRPMTGKEILDKVVFTEEERERYKNWSDENEILKDMNTYQSIQIEIQEVEVT